jgi:hypothetical protein
MFLGSTAVPQFLSPKIWLQELCTKFVNLLFCSASMDIIFLEWQHSRMMKLILFFKKQNTLFQKWTPI